MAEYGKRLIAQPGEDAGEDASAPLETSRNPFVGPRAFEAGEQEYFFGRDDEIAILTGLVMTRRAALFFAPSGAGKSSLLRAGLIPELERQTTVGRGERTSTYQKMRVLPILKVSGGIPRDVQQPIANIFIFQALISLYPPEIAADELAGRSLSESLAPYFAESEATGVDSASPQEGNARVEATLLIFDQFEELFTHFSERWHDRADFFNQVGQALATYPSLHVLFTMREDFIAELTPYVGLLPDQLRSRFRLERLQREAALQAVTAPIKRAGRSFAPGVAEELVDNMRRSQPGIKVLANVTKGTAFSDYVEPVHLQIVCRQLWEKLPAGQEVITTADVQKFGDVDQALTNFYKATLAKVVALSRLSPRRVRTWFSEQLITPARTRGLVYRGETETEGLPNSAVDVLNNAYIIRASVRAGDTWYELAHDRLVEPILEANRIWITNYQNPLDKATQSWLAGGRDPQRLIDGTQLALGQAYAIENPNDVLEEERLFLEASQRAETARIQEEHRTARRRRNIFISGTAIILVLAVLTFWAILNGNEAKRQAQLASSRELAARAVAYLAVDPGASILLALQAYKIAETTQAEDALRLSLYSSRIYRRFDVDDGQLISLAVSPDGTYMAAAHNNDGSILVWDLRAENAKPMPSILKPTPDSPDSEIATWDLAFSPDGRQLASAHSDGLRIWEASTGKLILSSREGGDIRSSPLENFYSVAFSPDGLYLAAGGNKKVRIWNIDTGQEIASSPHKLKFNVLDMAFSPDSGQIAIGGQDPNITIWDFASSNKVVTLTGHEDNVWTITFSPDGNYLASGSKDKTAIIWDLRGDEPEQLVRLYDHTNTVASLVLSANGHCLATAGLDRTVRLWDFPSGELLFTLAGHSDWVTGVAFRESEPHSEGLSPTLSCGRQLVSTSHDGSVRFWNIGPTAEVATFTGHQEPVESAAFTPDMQRVASGSDDGEVILWDAGTGQELSRWDAHINGRVNRVAFSPDGNLLATAGYDGFVRIWEVGSGSAQVPELIRELQHPGYQINTAAFSQDGRLIATASDDFARIWQVSSGKIEKVLEHPGVYGAAFSPDEGLLVTTGEEGSIKVWDPTTWESKQDLQHGTDVVYDAAFSHDGRLLATISWDGSVKIWTVADWKVQADLTGHVDRVYGVHFLPDDAFLVTSSADGTARVWEVATGRLARTLPGPEMNSLDVDAAGRLVVVGGEDGTVRMYTLNLADLIAKAEARLLQTGITTAECLRYLTDSQCQAYVIKK